MGSLRGKALAPAARRGFFLGAAEARHPKNQRARLFAEPPHRIRRRKPPNSLGGGMRLPSFSFDLSIPPSIASLNELDVPVMNSLSNSFSGNIF